MLEPKTINDFALSDIKVQIVKSNIWGFSFRIWKNDKSVYCYLSAKEDECNFLIPINLIHCDEIDCFICGQNSSTKVTQCKFLFNFMPEILQILLEKPEVKLKMNWLKYHK